MWIPFFQELDTEYPKVIGEWWTMGNFVRLNCWISFWISTYIFLDSFRVSGIRLYPSPTNKSAQETITNNYDVPGPEEYGNPSFPIMISIIFFFVSGICTFFCTNFSYELWRIMLFISKESNTEKLLEIIHPPPSYIDTSYRDVHAIWSYKQFS